MVLFVPRKLRLTERVHGVLSMRLKKLSAPFPGEHPKRTGEVIYRNELEKTFLLSGVTLAVYLAVFSFMDRINEILFGQYLLSGIAVMGIVVLVAFLYGSAVSHFLKAVWPGR